MTRLLAIFCCEALLFLCATLNIRACAKGWIRMTLGTDALIAGLSFSLIAWIAESGTWPEHSAYIAGALAGSYMGMRWTRRWQEAAL